MRKFNGFKKAAFAAAAAVGLMGSPVMAEGGPNTGNISVSGSLDIVTEYIFRGMVQENQGLLLQPSLGVDFAICEGFSLSTGIWNSIHNNVSDGSPETAEGWFEADWTVGGSVDLSDTVALGISYTNLYNPEGGGSFAEELGFELSYDDSGNPLLGDIALSPYVLVVIETDDGSDGAGSAGDEGSYLELGVAPEFSLIEGDSPVTLSVPVTLGLNLGDYYETGTGVDDDEDFGFLDIGLVASMPLDADSAWGAWTLSAGIHYIALGDSAQEISSNDFGVTGGGNELIYGTVGISFEY